LSTGKKGKGEKSESAKGTEFLTGRKRKGEKREKSASFVTEYPSKKGGGEKGGEGEKRDSRVGGKGRKGNAGKNGPSPFCFVGGGQGKKVKNGERALRAAENKEKKGTVICPLLMPAPEKWKERKKKTRCPRKKEGGGKGKKERTVSRDRSRGGGGGEKKDGSSRAGGGGGSNNSPFLARTKKEGGKRHAPFSSRRCFHSPSQNRGETDEKVFLPPGGCKGQMTLHTRGKKKKNFSF